MTAFIFGDLIILPILNIYRKYYEMRMSVFLGGTLYVAMVLAALAVEFLFGALGWVPATRSAEVAHASFSLNYTTVLNVLALVLAGWLYVRYGRKGGPEMMRKMKAHGKQDAAAHAG